MFKIFSRKNQPVQTSKKSVEPKYLHQYCVEIGSKDRTYVYAKSRDDAISKVRYTISDGTLHVDSRYYTRTNPGPKELYNNHPRGEVYAYLVKENAIRNPMYR